MNQTEHFISEFSRWATQHGLSKNQRVRLTTALRHAQNNELAERDAQHEVQVRSLSNSKNLRCYYDSPTTWLYYGTSDRLIAGVVAPFWGAGWRSISKDEYIAHIVGWFFHFAAQYIARSRIVSLVGGLAVTYGRACEFRYADLSILRVDAHEPCRTIEPVKAYSIRQESREPTTIPHFSRKNKSRELDAWIHTINGLDPFIHRAIYQYWRAVALLEAHFWEEAVTALDGVASVASQFIAERLKVAGNRRQALETSLGITSKDQKTLDRLYALRSDFGAHPSQSKWWDFAEIYDEDFEELQSAVKRLLWHLCQVEKRHRVVEPFPDSWSNWFQQNALMVLKSAW